MGAIESLRAGEHILMMVFKNHSYCNLMLQGRLGDAVSREMRGWPCSQITLRRFLTTQKRRSWSHFYSAWSLPCSPDIDSRGVHLGSYLPHDVPRGCVAEYCEEWRTLHAGWLLTQSGQADYEALLEILLRAFVSWSP